MAVLEPIGHERIRQQLAELAGRVAAGDDHGLHHAWLFSGPAGVGKFLTARWWATLLHCRSGGACSPACDSCRLAAGSVHPDIVETGLAEDARSFGVDASRELVHRLSLRASTPGPRVGIVRNAESMTWEAQNALLKTLEEPPGSCVIILVADNASAMLPTVRSRCRHLTFGALEDGEVVEVLLRLGQEQSAAAAAAACSRGSVARALRYDADGLADRETVLTAYEGVLAGRLDIESLLQTLLARKESGYALADLLEWQLAKVQRSLGHQRHEPSPVLAAALEAAEATDSNALLEHARRIEWTMQALGRNANAKLVIRDLLANVRP